MKRLFDQQEQEVLGKLNDAQRVNEALFDDEQNNDLFQRSFRPVIHMVFEDTVLDIDDSLKTMKIEYIEGVLDQKALKWINERSLELAKMVNGTSKDAVREILSQGFAEGWSIYDMKKSITELYGQMYKRRAEMVARTETMTASNEASLWRYERGKIKEVEFYAALDERTCEECLSWHGTRHSTKESHGYIPLHVSCRCVWMPVMEELE